MSDDNGYKNDENKLRFDLISPFFEEELARVLTYGANKYGVNNWQKLEDGITRYYAALRRHLNAFWQDKEVDEESGLSHLAHAAANIMFLIEHKRMQQYSEEYSTYNEDI